MMLDHLEAVLGDVVITVYEGEYDEENGEYSGPGIARLDNECIYEGEFVKGLFHGKGKFTWGNGMMYEGDFQYNHITGQGTYTYLDGSFYTGQVYDGKRHGQGKLTTSIGQIYEGDWHLGQRHGNGKMIYNEEGTTVYTGEWQDNLRNGYGTMKYASGNTFEGEWRDDKKNGYGIMVWRDLDEVYTGEWMDDKPHGFGEHIWGDSNSKTIKKQNCNIYRGYYEEGKRCGSGTFFYMNGSQYTGQWRDDIKEGPGIFIYPDGRIIAGNYNNNRLISCLDQDFQQLRATEDINPQYHLNLLISYFQYYPMLEINPLASLEERQTNQSKLIKDLERLLLKYNSYLKSIYKHYNEISNKLRIREIPYLPDVTSLLSGSSQSSAMMSLVPLEVQQRYYKFLKSTITARVIHKRFFCLNLEVMIRFLRELGLIDYYYTAWEVIETYQQMKEDQLTAGMKQYVQLLSTIVEKYKLEPSPTTASAINSPQRPETNGKASRVNSRGGGPPQSPSGRVPSQAEAEEEEDLEEDSIVSSLLQEADLKIGRLLDDYQDLYAFDTSFYHQVNQPILEHEFTELLVRIIGERQLKYSEYPLNLYHATEKVFAQLLLPFSSNAELRKQDFYVIFYDQVVQDVLRGRPNRNTTTATIGEQEMTAPFVKLEALWQSLPKTVSFRKSISLIPTGGTITLETFIKSIVMGTLKESNRLPPTITEEQVIRTLYALSDEFVIDTRSMMTRKICYEDFLEYLCRLIMSLHWISTIPSRPLAGDGEEERKEAANKQDEDEEEDEFNVVVVKETALTRNKSSALASPLSRQASINQGSSMEENLLYTQLMDWLPTLVV